MKMNPEIKKKWVDALRSGKYNQCEEELWDRYDGFCCLGVLSDLRRKEMKKGREEFFNSRYIETNEDDLLPASVAEWAGISCLGSCCTDIRVTRPDGSVVDISYLNDNGYSFHQIADIIEEQL